MTKRTKQHHKADAMARIILAIANGNEATAREIVATMGHKQWFALDELYVLGEGLKRLAYVPSDETKRLVWGQLFASGKGNELDWIDELAPESAERRAG